MPDAGAPRASVHASIHAIGRERWGACCGDRLEGFDYLEAVEGARLPGFDWRYVLVEAEGQPLIAAPGFITDYSLDTTLTSFGRKAVAALRRLAPRAFTVKLGALGSPCTEDVGVGFAAGVAQSERPALLQRALEAFEADACANGCGLFAIKDAPEPDAALWSAAAAPLGFRQVAGQPTAHVDIQFGDIDAYLAGLSSATRKDMRRKLKALDRLDVAVETSLDANAERVLELYHQTRARADMRFEDLTIAYFTGVLAAMPGRSLCVLYRDRASGEILAANLLIHDRETLLDKFFCMDARGREMNLYFVSWFTNIRLCLERGFKRYQSGQAGYEIKLRLGSRFTGASMLFRHRNPIVNRALQWAAPLLSEDRRAAA